MKTAFPLLFAAFAMLQPLRSAEPPFEVHEWGTMTQVIGSDGVPLQWYQPSADLAGLPSFVGMNPFQPKGAPAALLRMETPVLYFYPQTPMKATVSVTMDKGRITEWFPHPSTSPMINLSTGGLVNLTSPIEWQVELLPPDDKVGRSQIPPVPPGNGNHYAHAREVPDAWMVRSTHPTPGLQSEKFIFYRGAADLTLPVQVTAPSGSEIVIRNFLAEPIPGAFALRVEGGKASWTRTGSLAASPNPPPSRPIQPPTLPLEAATDSLADAMRKELSASGLTPAEAAAMVATWRDAWFKEPGTRVLCLLPESWINGVLPLKISPAPSKLRRVFIARLEVFTPEQEKTLARLLDQTLTEVPTPNLAQAFQQLQLGRFGSAGLERAVAMKRSALQSAYQQLEAQARKLPTAPVDAPKVSAR